MIRYAITDATREPGDRMQQKADLLALAGRWAALGVELVQLREKQMQAGALVELAREMVAALGPGTKLLVNGRADVALASGAAGVHLSAHPDELTPGQVRTVFARAGAARPLVSVSRHTLEEAERAREGGADFVLFAPVFEKRVGADAVGSGTGLEMLRRVCEAVAPVPVLALGGVSYENAAACLEAGAAGVAGIRLFAKDSPYNWH